MTCCVFGFGYNGFGQISPALSHDNVVKTLPVPVDLLVSASDIKLSASWSTTWALTKEGNVQQWGWVSTDVASIARPCISKLDIPGLERCRWTSIASPCSSGGVEKLLLYSKEDGLLVWLTELEASSDTCSSSSKSAVRVGRVDLSLVTGLCFIACSGEKVWATDDSGGVYVSSFPVLDSTVTEKNKEQGMNDDSQSLHSASPGLRTISFQRVAGFSHHVVQVACGIDHTLLLTSTGMVFSCGIGSRGQLGLGDITTHTTPQLVELLGGIHIIGIATGGWHSLALTNLGSVYSWGWNSSGQLGTCEVSADGSESIGQFGAFPEMVDFPVECDVMQVACGSRHSAAVAKDGMLFTWGWGAYGQLGHGDTSNGTHPAVVEKLKNDNLFVTSVCCGAWHTFALTERQPKSSKQQVLETET